MEEWGEDFEYKKWQIRKFYKATISHMHVAARETINLNVRNSYSNSFHDMAKKIEKNEGYVIG